MEATPTAPRRLTRSADDRMIAGVAAGLGTHLGVDPVLIRIAFVVLTFLGGSGIALYALCWLLVPDEGEERPVAADLYERAGSGQRRALAVVAAVLLVVAAGDLFLGRWTWPGAGLAPVAAVAAVILLATRRGHGASGVAGWFVGGTLAIAAVVASVAVAALVVVASIAHVPLRGGMGDRHWAPVDSSELRPAYHLAAGDLVLDLSGTELPEGTTKVRATVGAGRLLVRVPADADVSVSASSQAGEVEVFGVQDGGLGVERRSAVAGHGGHRLAVEAEAGAGRVEVVRG